VQRRYEIGTGRPTTASCERPASSVFRIVGRPTSRGLTWAWAQDDLDMATVPAARAELAELLATDASPRCLLVYLGAECFVDIRGLRMLVEAARQLRERDGKLAVVAPPHCVRVMASRLHLADELPLVASARQATSWALGTTFSG
jgi:anti-anti-sigma factor